MLARIRRHLPTLSIPGFLWMPSLLVVGIFLSFSFGGATSRLSAFSTGFFSVLFWIILFFAPWLFGFCLNRWLRRSERGSRFDTTIRYQLERIPWIGARVHGLHWLVLAVLLGWGVGEAVFAVVTLAWNQPFFNDARWLLWGPTTGEQQALVAIALFVFAMLVEPMINSLETWFGEEDKFSIPIKAAKVTYVTSKTGLVRTVSGGKVVSKVVGGKLYGFGQQLPGWLATAQNQANVLASKVRRPPPPQVEESSA